jgi:hypothetical protein
MPKKRASKNGLRGRTIVGIAEYVRLPEWRIGLMRAKIDTGARSSALHVANIRRESDDHVSFEVVLRSAVPHRHVQVVAPISRVGRVRSSNGTVEDRFFVKTVLELGPVRTEIEVSLTSRGGMRYRMLLGRTALESGFLIDPARKYVVTEEERVAIAEKRRKNARIRQEREGRRARRKQARASGDPA